MAIITAFITENGNALHRTFVEHIFKPTNTSLGFYRTDDNGSFTIDGGLANRVDIRIHARNSVVKMLDGENLNLPVAIERRVGNGDNINITTSGERESFFRLQNVIIDVYDRVWRQFLPYSRAHRSEYPAGKKNTHRETFASNQRIELSFPDRFNPQTISRSWVEPAGLLNASLPLMHIRNTPTEVFSTPEHAWSLLAHETGHAMHFTALSLQKRIEIEVDYAAYIANVGNTPHDFDVASTPFVAFIEAIGIFSERFFYFTVFVSPALRGRALQRAFTNDELNERNLRNQNMGSEYKPIGTGSGNTFAPTSGLRGSNMEGAVYAAIYVDFAQRVGLSTAINYIFNSQATTFDEYRSHIIGRNIAEHTTAINAVRRRWGM